ncbi:hypothetical protein HZ996_10520 [Cryomorphaceae bacterium]|nr:hypothetical protein HZ996_10520 [Cryomorphaceae bacterium]
MGKLKLTLYLAMILCSSTMLGQGRENLPQPVSEDSSLARLDGEVITGWTFGEDMRWYSLPGAIPVRTTSFRWENIQDDPNYALGEDNIRFIETFRLYYGTKAYYVMVKASEEGAYKYPARERGWETAPRIDYFMLEESEVVKIHAKDSIGTFMYQLKLVDHGIVRNIKLKKREDWVEEIMRKAIPREDYPWELVFHASLFGEQNVARFQFYAMHRAFKDIDAVRHVQKIRGNRIYGKPELMDYFYYEIPFELMFTYLRTRDRL